MSRGSLGRHHRFVLGAAPAGALLVAALAVLAQPGGSTGSRVGDAVTLAAATPSLLTATERPATPGDRPVAAVVPDATPVAVAPTPSATRSAEPSNQELRTHQDVEGYGPAEVSIQAGVPTRWTIESRSQQTCATLLAVPDLEIVRYLEAGADNVIELPPLEPGYLDYTCSMGMFWGRITVVDPGVADGS